MDMLHFTGEVMIIMLACFSAGTLPATGGRHPYPSVLLVLFGIALFPLMAGILFTAAFLLWLPVFLFKVMVIVSLLALIYFLFKAHHPYYGYLAYHSKNPVFILFLFYFFLGMEFASFGFSPWFVFLIIPLAGAGLMAGFIVMSKLYVHFKYANFIHFAPLMFFLFVILFKLI